MGNALGFMGRWFALIFSNFPQRFAVRASNKVLAAC